eukprot:gnl/Trimastix_PCT/1559.p1 GENE.gnl/Trimastix_PCT/1559~~gnl/Trimastix_PCT/1559.p1  ORF type:complete len:335 (-),score=71.51 gnl/Trimastix_PCT/1559:73-1077(-)
MQISDFEIQEKLGEGSYGMVFRAIHKSTGKLMALKKIIVEDDDEIEDAIMEIEIMREIKSEFSVRYFGSFKESDLCLYVAMELCELGAITNVMRACQRTLNEDEIAYVVSNVLRGLKYLHERRKIHRDIKGGNILINKRGEIKLADFGVAAKLTHTYQRRQTFIGSPYWMAPEIIQHNQYSFAVDVWSVGILAIELAEGRPPLYELPYTRALLEIPMKPAPTLSELHPLTGVAPEPAWTADFHDFLACSLQKDPETRWTPDRLLEHPFLASRADDAQKVSRALVAPLIERASQVQEETYTSERGATTEDCETFSSSYWTANQGDLAAILASRQS